ncbi:MAG TPA: hypothetical protein VFN35_28920, partial [Ktedonobacteraceae bacterium]|nr:hypothetical protein [Ktedonobacteraceae bacterium]
MKVHNYLWRLFRYRPWMYTILSVLLIIYASTFLGEGILVRSFVDTLTRSTVAQLTVWSIILFFLVARASRAILLTVNAAIEATLRHTIGALLRRNLFLYVLGLPGALALQ